MKYLKTVAIIFIFLIGVKELYSQQMKPYPVDCFDGFSLYGCYDGSYLGGQCKPESVDRYTSNPDAAFRVLIVYVQFQQDPYPYVSWWPAGSPPTYFGKLLSETKSSNSNWWDAYSETDARMSDYWMEVSRGQFNVIGKEVHVILDHDNAWYQSNGGGAVAMDELYSKLAANTDINWALYDQWSKNGSSFRYGPPYDGYVDMIYFIYRSGGTVLGNSSASFTSCNHPSGHIISNEEREIKILPSGSDIGSGFQIMGAGQPLDQTYAVSFIPAEHCHYTLGIRNGSWFGGHQPYGKVNNHFGLEEFLGPYELIRLGYFQTRKVDYASTSSYSLNDWTSRNNNPYTDPDEILELPIGDANNNEFFLIVNRQKKSTYDKIMWGDTAHGDPYRPLSSEQQDYGKGIYIYHAYPGAVGQGYQWQIPFDQECADGLFSYTIEGPYQPDWVCSPYIPFYRKSSIAAENNDNGGVEFGQNRFIHDGKSVGGWYAGIQAYQWLGIGKPSACGSGLDGTDRMFANDEEVWTSREWQGDRWDAWNKGYNEVFSPYSNPSTCDWNASLPTGIFVYLESKIGEQVNLKIYKAGEGGWDESEILQATPPSRPRLYLPIEIYNCNGIYGFPRIIWDNNTEPDMLHQSGDASFKRYRIYRTGSTSANVPPLVWNYIGIYDDYTPNDTANFIDNGTYGTRIYCDKSGGNDTYFRYRIKAVDVYGDSSVPSDFQTITGDAYFPDRPTIGNQGIPLTYSLLQNYPNPFNPTTDIKFELPKDNFVTVKVYNAIGEEVAVLINNEWKTTGRYNVKFDGSNLASGIYFYSIHAGNFTDTKKMVLIK